MLISFIYWLILLWILPSSFLHWLNKNTENVFVTIDGAKRAIYETIRVVVTVLTPYSTINDEPFSNNSVTTALTSSTSFRSLLSQSGATLQSIGVMVTPGIYFIFIGYY